MTANGNSRQAKRAYPPGIHAPTVTFFLPDGDRQEIDWATQEKHLEYLVKSGVHGSTFHPTPKTPRSSLSLVRRS